MSISSSDGVEAHAYADTVLAGNGTLPGKVARKWHARAVWQAAAPRARGDDERALLQRARAGDEEGFRQLTEPYRREIQVHCYRILGSLTDAEDALQETMLAAWRGLAGFQERSSLRSWLYRIATNQCLNTLRAASRRSPAEPAPPFSPPEPTRRSEITWLQPYPDDLLEGIADTAPGPEARYQATEAIELAFVAALQRMPPRQ